jgi:hypothetical protein
MNHAIELDATQAHYFRERAEVLKKLGQLDAAQDDDAHAESLTGNDSTTAQVSNAQTATASPLVGTWYVNQLVNGTRIEMTQNLQADGSYEATIFVTRNGSTERVNESGTYRRGGDHIHFATNVGNYAMPVKMQDAMLWLYFSDLEVWIGSVRR